MGLDIIPKAPKDFSAATAPDIYVRIDDAKTQTGVAERKLNLSEDARREIARTLVADRDINPNGSFVYGHASFVDQLNAKAEDGGLRNIREIGRALEAVETREKQPPSPIYGYNVGC